MTMPALLSVPEAARRLEVHHKTLYARIADGRVPAHVVDDLGMTRVRADAVTFYQRHLRWPNPSELEASASE